MVQLELPDGGWGGRRAGAGRPKTTKLVGRRARPELKARFPLHVTLSIGDDVGTLRTGKRFARIKRAFRYGNDRFGMRLVEFSVQGKHIHLIVEAENKRALSRGMQGLAIRVARGVNRASQRRGRVFADRYFAKPLLTPTQTRNAIQYVRQNWHKHQRKYGRWSHRWYIDEYSSMSGEASWFVDPKGGGAMVTAAPKTWLLRREGG